jgi:innexin
MVSDQMKSRLNLIAFPLLQSALELFGPSGGLQVFDGLCFLSQNNINEKVFTFLYFWYIFVAILGAINLARSFVMLAFKFMRTQDIRRMSNCNRTRRSDEFCYWLSDFGIWNMIRIVHNNLSPVLFEDLMKALMKNEDSLDRSDVTEVSAGDHDKRSKLVIA